VLDGEGLRQAKYQGPLQVGAGSLMFVAAKYDVVIVQSVSLAL